MNKLKTQARAFLRDYTIPAKDKDRLIDQIVTVSIVELIPIHEAVRQVMGS